MYVGLKCLWISLKSTWMVAVPLVGWVGGQWSGSTLKRLVQVQFLFSSAWLAFVCCDLSWIQGWLVSWISFGRKSFSLRFFLFPCRKASMVHADEKWWCRASSAWESGRISSVLGKVDIVVTWKEKDSPWEEYMWLGQEDRYCRPCRRLLRLLWDQKFLFWNCSVAGQLISCGEASVWISLLCL